MNKWVNVDIGDEITMPVGVIVETRIHEGKKQFRNPIIRPVCDIEYLDILHDYQLWIKGIFQ